MRAPPESAAPPEGYIFRRQASPACYDSTVPIRRALTPASFSWGRALLALALGLAMAAGVAVPHAPVAEHSGTPSGVEIDHGARHPGEPIHVESSQIQHHPACGACLLQLQGGSSLAVPAALPVPVPLGTLPFLGEQTVPKAAVDLGPARAAPASFLAS